MFLILVNLWSLLSCGLVKGNFIILERFQSSFQDLGTLNLHHIPVTTIAISLSAHEKLLGVAITAIKQLKAATCSSCKNNALDNLVLDPGIGFLDKLTSATGGFGSAPSQCPSHENLP